MAVITRTECLFFKSIRAKIQGIFWVMVLLGGPLAGATPYGDCEAAKRDAVDAGLPLSPLLDRPTSGQICGEASCCSLQHEQDVSRMSKHQIDAFLRDSISKLQSLIDTRARKFDGLFREIMNTSKREFHNMFVKTYGKAYLQNSDVFSDFFAELETYYKKGTVRLSETLETFFLTLYQRMFTELNKQYDFDEKYLECISEHMNDMKPFGDLPHKISLQLRRSFVATRTYHKALTMAAEVARKMANFRIDEECQREVVRMQGCGVCEGARGAGTCSDYCVAVMKSCLRHHTEFSAEWDKYTESLDKVADRLVGTYNIEMVVEPLNIKISEAIMNFQEGGTEVSKKIFHLCGGPSLSRRRRSAKPHVDDANPSFEIKYEPMKLGHKKRKHKKVEDEENVSTLERLIKDIKTKIRETRQFWAHLPYQYCNNPVIAVPPSANGNCWNGTATGAYNASSAPKASLKPSPLINEQTYTLNVYSEKLRKAYQGEEVEIVDDSEDNFEGSGSGSGDFESEETSEHTPRTEPPVIVEIHKEPIFPAVSSTKRPEVSRDAAGGASTMSLSRALAQYVLPIVLVWFGGAITDLL